MNNQNKLFAWQETKIGLAVIVLFDAVITYVWVLLAIDTGSLLNYFLAFLFLLFGITAAVKLFKKVTHK
ncbi:MAG TPA: hypothetical protein VF575_05345 [Candidatus Saccharimonadales bacterium]|jgi:hypothetical protein